MREVMALAKGNRTRAAELLKISVRQLYNKLKRYGLD
ncbi:MAG: hypothetical protein LLG06_19180 [Desulfobacteraceae bacterium]|nr:hypothetical protein [Desulfobacteraceae bacterium]